MPLRNRPVNTFGGTIYFAVGSTKEFYNIPFVNLVVLIVFLLSKIFKIKLFLRVTYFNLPLVPVRDYNNACTFTFFMVERKKYFLK